MFNDPALLSAIDKAVARLLRPLVRLLLKHSYPYSAFEAVAKRVYVETAMQDFALPGKKPSISRAAILTGLTRKDVTLLAEPSPSKDQSSIHYNRAARVLTAWVRDPAFVAADGKPRHLAMDGGAGFAELVRLYGGDVPWRAVLDELLRVGAVDVDEHGNVKPVERAFVPSASVASMVGILGTDVSELIETITYNIDRGDRPPRYQRKVMHRGIGSEHLPKFRQMSALKSQALLEEFDAWLTKRDSSDVLEAEWPESARARVGVGVYYYEGERDEDGGDK